MDQPEPLTEVSWIRRTLAIWKANPDVTCQTTPRFGHMLLDIQARDIPDIWP
jgi:hypothetical protein